MNWEIDKLKSYVVYGILDTETNRYIYIGSTKRRLWDRKNSHSAGHGNTELNRFFEEQKKKSKKVVFSIIHECEINNEHNIDLEYWEYFYIKKFIADGHPLCNRMIRDIPHPATAILDKLKSKRYNNAWVASELYKDLDRKSAISKFRNKLQNIDGRAFTAEEMKKLEIILQ